jgi:hypothetical protein
MARPANQSSDWDFNVQPMRLLMPDGSPSNVFANVRTDKNQSIGVISEKGYGLIQNADFISTVRAALDALGLTGYSEDIITTQNGARLYATYTFNNRVRSISNVGDNVGLRLRFANSFDGSLAAIGELMALVLRCLNGMTMEKGEFSLARRHNANINLDFVKEVIGKAVNSFDASLALFDRMANVKVSDEQGITMLKHIPLSEKTREEIQALWVNPNFAQGRERTLYALYDAATEYLRNVESSRFEYSAKTGRVIVRHLAKALDPEHFAAMVMPIVDTEVVIIEN